MKGEYCTYTRTIDNNIFLRGRDQIMLFSQYFSKSSSKLSYLQLDNTWHENAHFFLHIKRFSIQFCQLGWRGRQHMYVAFFLIKKGAFLT